MAKREDRPKPSTFGMNLRRLRGKLTQEELAERAGVARGTVANLELGTVQSPIGDTGEKLAKALGVDVSVLYRKLDTGEPQLQPAASGEGEPITMDEFFSAAQGVLDETAREKMEEWRGRLKDRLPKREWLAIMLDAMEESKD